MHLFHRSLTAHHELLFYSLLRYSSVYLLPGGRKTNRLSSISIRIQLRVTDVVVVVVVVALTCKFAALMLAEIT